MAAVTRGTVKLAPVVVAAALCGLAASGCGGVSRAANPAPEVTSPAAHPAASATSTSDPTTSSSSPSATTPAGGAPVTAPTPRSRPRAPFAVGLRTVTFVDNTRTMRYPGRPRQLRKLVTVVRYPALGRSGRTDVRGAPSARASGPFPLLIFGHGFAVTPRPYSALLVALARAGFVVAAPIFPLENAHAPGGPNEADLVNQPRDMSFVITQMLAAAHGQSGPFAGLVDPGRIAVSGQSDGGETALAVAYDRYFLDRRVKAAIIYSGAKIPGVGGFDFPTPSPPLLATQGTADQINQPSFTNAFFGQARRPKFLLEMFGAGHLPPYTYQQPQLGIVERVSIDFLNRYVRGSRRAARLMSRAGNVSGLSALSAYP